MILYFIQNCRPWQLLGQYGAGTCPMVGHLVALHEATDALHQAMCTAPYCPGGMAIKIVLDLPAFVVIVDSVVAHNHS
jgi:hypothetical protein